MDSAVKKQKKQTDTQAMMAGEVMRSRDELVAKQQEQIDDLNAKLEELTRYIQLSKMDPDDPMGKDKEEENRAKVMAALKAADEVTEMSDSNSSDAGMQALRVQQFGESCKQYQDIEVARTNNLNNLQTVVSRLLKKGNCVVGTQTDPVEGLGLGNEGVGLDKTLGEAMRDTCDSGDFTRIDDAGPSPRGANGSMVPFENSVANYNKPNIL